uniref:Uncharacterized protein MANES_09G068000 n=1 Tax=Rhizophora mucronata TaxID=61149 RepID=A0A2P2N3B5_RHIMU
MKNRNQNRRADGMDSDDRRRWDFKNIMKDIELLGTSHRTWKERKELENRKVVSLGGKPLKKQRLPLSVARMQMKKQKEREEKMLQENLILGRFGGNRGGDGRRTVEKPKRGDGVLKSTEGFFRHGVLDVKHLLKAAPSRDDDSCTAVSSRGKKKNKKKNSGGQRKGRKNGGGRKYR